uniref:Uncharacterized protein n=1 Tax=uncultured delta proteobacterium HF0070_07E19 TaxID=710823 RepID=E0XXA1_9DELT|nr:hypothetical protein [uncultured delta proteobacterium HF0070_07E19]
MRASKQDDLHKGSNFEDNAILGVSPLNPANLPICLTIGTVLINTCIMEDVR